METRRGGGSGAGVARGSPVADEDRPCSRVARAAAVFGSALHDLRRVSHRGGATQSRRSRSVFCGSPGERDGPVCRARGVSGWPARLDDRVDPRRRRGRSRAAAPTAAPHRGGGRARPWTAGPRRRRIARVHYRRHPDAAPPSVDHHWLGARRGRAGLGCTGASPIAACCMRLWRCSVPFSCGSR